MSKQENSFDGIEFLRAEEIRLAKETLEKHGYYTKSLWQVEDVGSLFKCTDEEALNVLDGALNNEATMEQIWYAIHVHGEDSELTKIED